ncbi:MAG: hypothetical protein CK548_05955 [Opitutia bacterium]|nr:MAG: hypothetical protein CK548_05955 [Opitutae bacterium]
MSSALRLLAASAVSVLAVVPITAATLAEKIPGQSYFGTDPYVDYIAGDLPVVLNSPHGGRRKPDPLPDRADGFTIMDADTLELVRAGHRVHFVASHRSRVTQ